MTWTPSFILIHVLGAALLGCQGGQYEEVGTQTAALNSATVYKDPSGSQTINQPSGTGLFVNRINGVRVADQFSGTVSCPTGTPDIGCKVNDAIADLGSQGGRVSIPAGTYSFTHTILLSGNLPVTLIGDGPFATKLNYTGSGDAIVIQNNNVWPASQEVSVRDLSLFGTGAASQVGVHQIDSEGVFYENVVVQDFYGNGGAGFSLENRTSWNERATFIKVTAANCKTGFRFWVNGGTSSFMRTRMIAVYGSTRELNGNQNFLSLEGGANLQQCDLEVWGNAGPSSGQTHNVISATGGSTLYQSVLLVNWENNGAGTLNSFYTDTGGWIDGNVLSNLGGPSVGNVTGTQIGNSWPPGVTGGVLNLTSGTASMGFTKNVFLGSGASSNITSATQGSGQVGQGWAGPSSMAVRQWQQIFVNGVGYWTPLFQ